MHLIPLLLFVLWMKPGLVLTPKVVDKLFDKFAAQYFSKKPEGLKVEIKSPGLLSKKFLIEAKSFCLKTPESCFEIVHAEARVKIVGVPKVELQEIGPIDIRNESFKYETEAAKASPTPKPTPGEHKQIFTVSNDLKINPIWIDFPNIKIIGEDETIQGQARLDKQTSEDLQFFVKAASNRAMKLDVNGRTGVAYNRTNPVEIKLALTRGSDPPQSAQASIDGNLNWTTLRGEIKGDAEAKNMVPWIETLAIRNLKASRQEKLKLRAELDVDIEPQIAPQKKSVLPAAPLSQRLKGKIQADEQDGIVQYSVSVDPITRQGILIEARANGRYPYQPDEKSFYGLQKLLLRVAVPEFQQLVQRFKKTSFAIPAPFNSMKGPMEFVVGDVDKNLEGASVPLKFDTDLTSNEQAIVTRTRGKLDFVPATAALKINGETHINQIKMTMPDLKILEPIPLVTYDKRIVSAKEKRKEAAREQREEKENKSEEESRNEFNWKMTSESGGIQIYHPILKPYAPINVDWQVGDHPKGEISFNPFVIDYLNRPAKVARMRFYQDPKTLAFSYDGRLVVKKTDYTIFVDIFKVGDKTKVELTSSPPLSEEDIVSVLLFNDVTAALDQDQSSSVGSTRSAIANRALGLFSILALSSTPIEAVNYNAATGVYSARVRLASGLTATVGTNWDQSQEVALRKRLGRNFVLSTVLQSPSGDMNDTQKTMLEWFRRF